MSKSVVKVRLIYIHIRAMPRILPYIRPRPKILKAPISGSPWMLSELSTQDSSKSSVDGRSSVCFLPNSVPTLPPHNRYDGVCSDPTWSFNFMLLLPSIQHFLCVSANQLPERLAAPTLPADGLYPVPLGGD